MSFFSNPDQVPGMGTRVDTQENQVWFGKEEQQLYAPGYVVSTAVDAGNTPTTLLRAGLIMGRIAASGKLKQWAPTAVDGSQYAWCVLAHAIDMLTYGTAADRFTGKFLIRGNLKAGALLVGGNASLGISGDAYEMILRRQLLGRFIFDDDLTGTLFGSNEGVRNLAATTLTLTAADNDVLVNCVHSAAMTITLPTPRLGLRYRFVNSVDQNMIIAAAAAGQLITFNDIAADSVAFSTAGNKIGASCEVLGVLNGAGTAQFMVIPSGANTMTVT